MSKAGMNDTGMNDTGMNDTGMNDGVIEREGEPVGAVRLLPEHGRSAAVAHHLVPDLVASDAAERPITVDQSNVSVVVGEAVVVKWLQPPVAQPSSTVALLRHLGAAGFVEMPTFHGQYMDRERVRAMVTSFVPGATDGWDWFVEELTDAIAAGSLEGPLRSADAVGMLAGRLHVAFATPTSFIAEPVGVGSLGDEHATGLALLDEAVSLTSGPEGERLTARASQIRAMIDALTSLDDVAVQHIHGDLHVGQLLRSPTTLVVNDFDGDPIVLPAARHRRRSAMVDLAALMQSVDHVGRIVARRHPEWTVEIDRFITAAVDLVAIAYRRVRPMESGDDVLLAAFRTIQELHEFVYAHRKLPRWLYVPDAALTAMFTATSG